MKAIRFICLAGFSLVSFNLANLQAEGGGHPEAVSYNIQYNYGGTEYARSHHGLRGYGGGYIYPFYCSAEEYYYYTSDLFWRKPVRYHLPWNRLPITVSRVKAGKTSFYQTIPTLVENKPEAQTAVLEHPGGFVEREQFLIETALRGDHQERLLAAEELGEYRSVMSVAVMVDVLFNDGRAEVRQAAAKSLGETGLAIAYEPLRRRSAEEMNEEVQGTINEAIETIKNKSDAELIIWSETPEKRHGTQRIADYLEDLRFGRAQIRVKAVEELGEYNESRAVASLINVLINDRDQEVRQEAAKSLGEIGDGMAVPFLEAAQKYDQEKSVRKEAERSQKAII